jgi:hypothetical protein
MKKLMILFLVLSLSLIPLVSAFGISTPYWKENPLVMQPGESKDITFNLQNMVGDTDYTIHVVLMNNSNIANITDASDDYIVKAQTADTYVHMHIGIANNATIGTVYPITLSFATVTAGNSGVSIGSSIEKSFDIVVGQKIEKPGIPVAVWILIAIVIIIAAVVLLTKKKKRR